MSDEPRYRVAIAAKNVVVAIIQIVSQFLASIAALYLGSSLTDWLSLGAELGQSYTTKGRPHIETWGLHNDIKDNDHNDNDDDNNKDDNDNNNDNDNKGKLSSET